MEEWGHIGASERVLRWLRDGVAPQWTHAPPPPFDLSTGRCAYPPAEEAFLRAEIARCLATGAWEEAPSPDPGPGWCLGVSPTLVVPKGSSGYRVVVDLRHLNSFCAVPRFRQESLALLPALARPGDWAWSLDLQDGYHHVPLHPAARPFFGFRVLGRLFRAAALPFGWSASPFVFTKVMLAIARHLRGRGHRLLLYLDDVLFLAPSPQAALAQRAEVSALLARLGLRRNPTKGVWEPSQRLPHLGLELDLSSGLFSPPRSRLDAIRRLASSLLGRAVARRRWVPSARLARLAGLAASLTLAIRPAIMRTRAFHDALRPALPSLRKDVRLSSRAVTDLRWWAALPDSVSAPLWPPPTVAVLTTDASDSGWGATLGPLDARGLWTPQETFLHSTAKELCAVLRAVESFSQLRGQVALLRSDNVATVAAVRRGASRSPTLARLARLLWRRLDALDCVLRPVHLPGRLNERADRLSRLRTFADWSLRPEVFRALEDAWGPHSVDRFASEASALLPRFNARWLSPAAEAMDAFTVPWADEVNFVNPPWALLPRALAKLRAEGAAATVIAPFWPARPWWPLLVDLATVVVLLPPSPVAPPPSWAPLPPPEPLRSVAWRLCAALIPGPRHLPSPAPVPDGCSPLPLQLW